MPHKSRTRRKTQWAPFFWWFGIFPGLVVLWEYVNEDLRFLEESWYGSDSEALCRNDKAEMLKVIAVDSDQEGRPYLQTRGHEKTLYSIEYLVKKALSLPDDFKWGKIPENIFFEVSMDVFNIFLMNMCAIINLGGMSDFPEEALQCESLADVNKVLLKRIHKLETMRQVESCVPKDLVNIILSHINL